MVRRSYRKLNVWQRAMELVESTYMATKALPDTERFGLTSQLRRAAVSIPANIAEGYGRTHRGDYLRHLSISRGSLFELETLLALTVRLKLIARSQALPTWGLAQETGKMLTVLMSKLQASPQTLEPRP